YLVNLAAPDDEVYKKSVATMKATMDAATAIGADGVIFHVGSHLGAGFESGLKRTVRAMKQILKRCDGDPWLLMENSAGTGRAIDRRAGDALRPARRPPTARAVPRLMPSVRIRGRRHRSQDGQRPRPRPRQAVRHRPRPSAAHQRLRDAARLEPRPAREHPEG